MSRLALANLLDHDIAFAGFFGQPIALTLRLAQARPIVLDAFVSAHDTLCFDRRQFSAGSPAGRLAFALDLLACRVARTVTVDTIAQADYFADTFRIPRDKLWPIYVGFDSAVFRPAARQSEDNRQFVVLHYGTQLPVHGIEHIVAAARLLAAERTIRFRLIGHGPVTERARTLAAQWALENVEFIDWVPYHLLSNEIAAANICLGGHFGSSGKARRTIAGKTFQILAVGRATILGDGPANRELFTPGVHAEFCPPANPTALAETIHRLWRDSDRCVALAVAGQQLVWERFAVDRMADDWEAPIRAALTTPKPAGQAPTQIDRPLRPR